MQYKEKEIINQPKGVKYVPLTVHTANAVKNMGISDIEVVGDTAYAKIGEDWYLWSYEEKKTRVLTPEAYKMRDIYPDIYTTMTDLPDNLDVSKLLVPGAPGLEDADYSEMFYGCQSLKTIPEFDTINAVNYTRMFAGCRSLPKVFPWPLYAYGEPKMDGIFDGSSVEEFSLVLYIGNGNDNDAEEYLREVGISSMNLTFDNMDSTGTLKKITLLRDNLTPWKTLTRT